MDEDLSSGERLQRARELMDAIAACEWEDAELVMSSFLYEFRTGSPSPAFLEYEDEASFWARLATFDELLANFIEIGKRLVNRNLGTRGRIRMIERMVVDLPSEEVGELIERIKPTDNEDKVA